jgi:hypothetical protein
VHINDAKQLIVEQAEPEAGVLEIIGLRPDGGAVKKFMEESQAQAIEVFAELDEEIAEDLTWLKGSVSRNPVEESMLKGEFLKRHEIPVTYVFPAGLLGLIQNGAQALAAGKELWESELASAKVNGPDVVAMDLAVRNSDPQMMEDDSTVTQEVRLQEARKMLEEALLAQEMADYISVFLPSGE